MKKLAFAVVTSLALAADNTVFGSSRGASHEMRPVIPLVGSALAEVPQPSWPRQSRAAFDHLARRLFDTAA